MSRATLAMKAVLRKDFLQLWPFAALAAATLLGRSLLFQSGVALGSDFRTLIEIANGVACCALLVAVVHQDSLASIRHDWLTRPVPRTSLFLAKALFIAIAITVPADVGMIVANLLEGRSAAESIMEGAQFSLVWIAPLLIVAAAAAITNSMLQVAGVVLGAIAVAMVIVPISTALGGNGEEIFAFGAAWIAEWSYLLLALIGCGVVLWLQYAHRRTRQARVVAVIVTLLAAFGPAYITWPYIFGIQKLFSSPEQERKLTTTLAPGCFPTITVNDSSAGTSASASPGPRAKGELHPSLWPESWRARVGADAIAFSTTVESTTPAGWHASYDNVRLAFVSKTGDTLATLRPARFTPDHVASSDTASTDTHFWLLARATYDALRPQGAHLELRYSLSLLEPIASISIPADGSRHPAAGLGICGAARNGTRRTVLVDCLKRGPQPALLSAKLQDAPPDDAGFTKTDYRPALLELFTVQRRSMSLAMRADATVPVVTITAFQPRAHVDRTFNLPGVLGGAQCLK